MRIVLSVALEDWLVKLAAFGGGSTLTTTTLSRTADIRNGHSVIIARLFVVNAYFWHHAKPT